MERTYTHIGKTGWPPGPWQDEPDKMQFTDPATDLPCLIVRGQHGSLCGYVGVTEGHPDYGANYNDVPVEVHGGLTFAGPCQEGVEETGICHIPQSGQPERVWWLGFDCAHAGDFSPAYAPLSRLKPPMNEVYRTLEYVRSECEALAGQLLMREAA